MKLNSTEHPIRMFVHGFSKPFNKRMSVLCSYPENPEHKLKMQGEEQDVLLLYNQWEVAGKPNVIWWFPRSSCLSFGYTA